MEKYNRNGSTMRIGPGPSIILLICWWILCLVLGSLIIASLGGNLRLAAFVQNAMVFVLPPILSAIIISSRPFEYLRLTSLPSAKTSVLAILCLIAAIPILNRIVVLNEAIQFPASLHEIEAALRNLEEIADNMVIGLIGTPTVWSLIICIAIVGLLTGFAEELFFRGALQTTLCKAVGSAHKAIWITAIVFSFMHFEFFGFVPRLLLGAFLGYLMYWSNTTWLPALVHALNNSLVITALWLKQKTGQPDILSSIGENNSIADYIAIIFGVILFCIFVTKLKRGSIKKH